MVDQQLRVDAEHAVEQLLIIKCVRRTGRAARKIAHRVNALRFQLPGDAGTDAPEIGQRPVLPERFAVLQLVQLGNAHAVCIRLGVLGFNVHSDLGKVEIRADPGCGGDAGRAVDVKNDLHGERSRREACVQIRCGVDKHLIDRVDVQILRRDVFEIDLVDLCGGLHIKGHPRRRDDIVQRKGGLLPKCVRIAAAAGKLPPGGGPPRSIDGGRALHDLKQPRAPRNAVGLESGGHGKADSLFRPALVRDDKMRSQRIQPARHAFDRSIKGFQINGKIAGTCHTESPPLDMDMIPPEDGLVNRKSKICSTKRKEEPSGLHPDMQAAGCIRIPRPANTGRSRSLAAP